MVLVRVYKVLDAGSKETMANAYYEDAKHRSFLIEYEPYESYEILVAYKWYGSPTPDYTVKVYSRSAVDIESEETGQTN